MKAEFTKWSISISATVVTIGICYFVGERFTYASFVFSWILNFWLMTWYTLLVNQFKPTLDSSYFKEKSFEKEGKIYKYVGVHVFRRLLIWIGWEKIHKQKNPIKNNVAALQVRDYDTRTSELGHTIIAVLVFATALGATNSLQEAKWLLITNVLLNIYPVIVQRYNRPRYTRIIDSQLKEKAIQ